MRKHIFGFALFSLIFASFALVFAFFYAPSIPPKEAVKPPISQAEMRTEKPYSCNLRRNKLSYEVISSELDGFKLISKVKVFWNGTEKAPEKIYLRPMLFTLDQKGSGLRLGWTTFNGVFGDKNEVTLVVTSDLDIAAKLVNEEQNWYVNYEISNDNKSENYSLPNLAEVQQVLFVHDKK